MKNKFLIILMLFSVMITFCQNETITKNFTRTKVEKIDFSKIYYKKTGKKIEKNEIDIIIANLIFWPIYMWVCTMPYKLLQHSIDQA